MDRNDSKMTSTIGDDDDDLRIKAKDVTRYINTDHRVQLRRLTKKFGDFTAVNRLSLSIDENEIFSILGHNGAGKTTAIYMLTGMYVRSCTCL